MELPGSEEPFTRKSRYYSSESSDSESDSSGSSSGGSDDGPQRRMSVNAKTVFIQKVGENGLPETVYQVSESSAVEESSQDSSGAIRADETSKSSTVVTAFQINAGVQVQTGGGCATMPAQPGCPFDRAQIIAPPLPDAPPPPLPEDAPPLPTEACEKPAPPPDEAEATNEKQQAAGVGAGASGVVDSDSDGDELDSDVDKMLDASLEERRKAEQVVLVNKTVCKRYTKDIFDVLPEDWVVVTHNCGLPVYLHRKTRVCTWARPYFLGTGSARKHEVPQSAIPCLHYRRTKEKVLKGPPPAKKRRISQDECPSEQQKASGEDIPVSSTSVPDPANASSNSQPASSEGARQQLMNKVEIESAKECQRSLSVQALKDYARNVFDLEDIVVRKFKSWTARREFQREKKLHSRPLIPSTTHLVTCELPAGSGTRTKRKEFVLNPSGKGPVGILHEFVQHSLREQPKYIFHELPSSERPYCATLTIGEIKYGDGYGSSKKLAKVEAARAALSILVPSWKEMQEKEEESRRARAGEPSTSNIVSKEATGQQELAFFDAISIEDPRLAYLCTTTGQSSPFQILVQCLKRNFGLSSENDIKQQISKENEKSQKMEYGMSVGRHEARVTCKNKRDGKQLASQQLLAKMHPYLHSWGAILRLYGQGSFKSPKEKREQQNEITELQTKAASNAPNYEILNKLRIEMLKLAKEQTEQKNPSQSSEQIKMVDI
ncbi:microprocessor complex subunit DGCR8-like [Varroa jacobsoni]|uniref:Microprocessor complex subunit DGCR8 n=1 Tax=Varroa destructor TaxID=109461 RepID=A0A7M7KHH3_VARDE|nr:microprocessor complex subunit DGCR8-like [Varroa destructor]XP_022666908.1 microprocessor complex subunit DGCR8-like [Varroa destructor]XP_022666909.1 microprocessor complex subunit DGCR8-like [Varroa destructor]XP_022692387.1 microprocessor complex subunit DGCR8-like [Varroa jacobsoni]XP_022692396.1 microprocessor complex subunit DGCR8-like [Varroa jacobsoni]XP_022692402.1 microprocessor complex subunit DGCR8-like [Varroa jacobsoni]